MFGTKAKIGIILPANNSVLEPELWSQLPSGVSLHTTRIMASGDLTPAAVRAMEGEVYRAVGELMATGVDLIVYADMVTTFIMDADWNLRRTREISEQAGIPCISAYTALTDVLAYKRIKRFRLLTPYPADIHALCKPYFETAGYVVTADDTLDILAMSEVPKVTPARLRDAVKELPENDAHATVMLATDLPTFVALPAIETATGLPAYSSNLVILWAALRRFRLTDEVAPFCRLFRT